MLYSPYNGLTSEEVELSRLNYGTNALKKRKKNGFFRQFVRNFGDPIIKVLLAVLAINLVFLFRNQNWFEILGIAIAVFLATLVSTISEYGSEAAFEKLQEEASRVTCRVCRGGHVSILPIEELVVGDVVLLQAGEPIPADGEILSGELRVDQSALNGESGEVKKAPSSPLDLPTLLQENRLFRGSVVCSGEGVMKVEKIGDQTFYGGVADELQEETRESPLKLRLADLAGKLSKLGFVAAILVAFADLFHSFVIQNNYSLSLILQSVSTPTQVVTHLLHAAMLSLTVIVVAVPEGLPMMITLVLSSNMRRMLKDHVLVRKLVGIETSGSLNILFTDKTGTLTRGKPSVSLLIDGNGKEYSHRESLARTPFWELMCLSGYYNTDAQLSAKDIIGGNSTDKAMLEYVRGRKPFNTTCTILNKIPFDSSKKWSGVEISGDFFTPDTFPKNRITLIKGAPDRILSICRSYMDIEGNLHDLDSFSRIHSIKKELESRAMRLLAIAISPKPLDGFPKEGILLGVVGLRDELRSDVRRSVAEVKNAGIQVVMMTGDSPETAKAIAENAGLMKDTSDILLTNDQLTAMSDQRVLEILPRLRVVARALPSDKSRLVQLAQQKGLVVGMTGDGINDAPALKKADVGFAMGSGTEVAKQAGDIIILNNHFSSISKAILYGRTIFKSIRKFIVFQLTMNLCAVGVSLIGPFLGIDTPVTVMQMLWINIIMDTLAGLAFAGEPPLAEYMRELPKKRSEPILNRYMINEILCTGGFTVLLCTAFLKLSVFKVHFRYDVDPIIWMTAFFALFIFCSIFNSFNTRTTRLNLLTHLRSNRYFLVIISAIVLIQIALIYYGGSLFRTTPLYVSELLRVVLISLLVIPVDLARKIILRLNHRKGTL